MSMTGILYKASGKKVIAFNWIFSKIPTNNLIESDIFFSKNPE